MPEPLSIVLGFGGFASRFKGSGSLTYEEVLAVALANPPEQGRVGVRGDFPGGRIPTAVLSAAAAIPQPSPTPIPGTPQPPPPSGPLPPVANEPIFERLGRFARIAGIARRILAGIPGILIPSEIGRDEDISDEPLPGFEPVPPIGDPLPEPEPDPAPAPAPEPIVEPPPSPGPETPPEITPPPVEIPPAPAPEAPPAPPEIPAAPPPAPSAPPSRTAPFRIPPIFPFNPFPSSPPGTSRPTPPVPEFAPETPPDAPPRVDRPTPPVNDPFPPPIEIPPAPIAPPGPPVIDLTPPPIGGLPSPPPPVGSVGLPPSQARLPRQQRQRERCREVKRKRTRGRCYEGFFEERKGRTKYTRWREVGCLTGRPIKREEKIIRFPKQRRGLPRVEGDI